MLTKEKYFKADSLVENQDKSAFLFYLFFEKESQPSDYYSYNLINEKLDSIINGLNNDLYFIEKKFEQVLTQKLNCVKDKFELLGQSNLIKCQSTVYDYVGAYFDVLIYLFSLKEQLTETNLIEKNLINQIVNLGKYEKAGNVYISFFNPLILNIILMGNEKYIALNNLCEFSKRSKLHTYLFLQKTARLFADRIFYDGEKQIAYKINGFTSNEDMAFSLKSLDSNGISYEEIDLSRIAEKIYLAIKKYFVDKNFQLNCLITGIEKSYEDVKDSTECGDVRLKDQYEILIEVLKLLIERDEDLKTKELKISYCSYIEYYSNEQQSNGINLIYASTDQFFEAIKDDNKNVHVAFILDTMFLYTPFYVVEQKDDASFLNYLEESIIEFYNNIKGSKNLKHNVYSLGNNKEAFLFYKNLTPVQDLADRLIAMLKTPYTYNCKFKIDVKDLIISNLNKLAIEKNKLFYIFISRNETFFKNRYNDYQFVRAERYNGKDIKIVRLAKDSRQILLNKSNQIISEKEQKGINITAYQFFKMFLSDKEIISNFFGEYDNSIIKKLMAISLNFNIKNRNNKNKLVLTADNMSVEEKDFNRIFDFIKQLITFIFKYEKNNFINDKSEDNLSYCVRKGLYYALLSKAKSYEQILLTFLIKNEINYFNDVEFHVQELSYNFLKDLNSIDNYAYLHNVINIIKVFDNGVTNRKMNDLEMLYWKNGLDGKLDEDLVGVLNACVRLNYCQSNVYKNILNYLN